MTDLKTITLEELEKVRSDWEYNKSEKNIEKLEYDFEILYNLIYFHIVSRD